MPSYLHPGVYIEEIPSGSKPIEGVSTSVTAFVGPAFRGPANTPILIGSWDEYVAQFGDYRQSTGIEDVSGGQDSMGLAVLSFYQNGGKAAYICRMVQASPAPVAASVTLQDSGATDVLTITASSEGAWANDIEIRVTGNASLGTFDLEVGYETDSNGDLIPLSGEKFLGLSMEATDDNFVEKIVNASSKLIQASIVGTPTTLPDNSAPAGTPLDNNTAGANAAATATDYMNFYNNSLRKVRDVSVIVLPGQTWPAAGTGNQFITNTITHCESTMSRVLIIDPENTEFTDGAQVDGMNLPTSTYTTLYYPWVQVPNPLYSVDNNPTASATIAIPPSAIAAGMWTKVDGKRGVWKAPAGVETRISVSGLEENVEDLEQDYLNPRGVNCIRNRPGYGSVFWGSRTLATKADPEWRYVPVRRTAIYIEQSIYNGIQWSVFEPNDHPLWSALRVNIGSFMNGMFRAGAFQGATADEAYFVRCGLGDTMTQGDIDRGQVIIVVGFAPLKPAEFVILRLQQKINQE